MILLPLANLIGWIAHYFYPSDHEEATRDETLELKIFDALLKIQCFCYARYLRRIIVPLADLKMVDFDSVGIPARWMTQQEYFLFVWSYELANARSKGYGQGV